MTLPIDSIETLVVRLPTRTDFRWNGLERPLGEVLVVRARSGEHVGYGETVPLPDWAGPDGSPFGETTEIAEVVIHELVAPTLLGNDAADLAGVRALARSAVIGYPYAVGALDVAVHDLVARAHGVAVCDLYGGRRRQRVPIAHMIGLMSPDAALEEAEAAAGEGCRAFQIKGGQDPHRDATLVGRLRGLLGDEVFLRVDANCGYGTWKTALAAVSMLAGAGADMVEQPLADPDGLRRVSALAPVPIMADEACWSPQDAFALARDGAVDALSIYVGKAGGIANAIAVSGVSRAAGLPHDLNGSLEAGIGNAASVQVALASDADLLPSVLPISGPASDLPTRVFGRYFVDDVVAAGMRVVDGGVELGDGPGLGVEIDEERLAAATVRRRATDASSVGEVAVA